MKESLKTFVKVYHQKSDDPSEQINIHEDLLNFIESRQIART